MDMDGQRSRVLPWVMATLFYVGFTIPKRGRS